MQKPNRTWISQEQKVSRSPNFFVSNPSKFPNELKVEIMQKNFNIYKFLDIQNLKEIERNVSKLQVRELNLTQNKHIKNTTNLDMDQF